MHALTNHPVTRTIRAAAAFAMCVAVAVVAAAEPVGPPVPTPASSEAEPSESLPAAPEHPEQISAYVREIFQDRDGNLWFGTNGEGVCRYDGSGLTFFDQFDGFGGQAVRGIVQDEHGAMWFATNLGVCRYRDGEFTNYWMADGLSDSRVWSLMLDRSGVLWAGTHEGVCWFDGESFQPFPLPRVEVESPASRFSPKVVFAMHEDHDGAIWFGTDGEGVHRYDGDSFTSYTTADGLAGDVVRAIEVDRLGAVWVGTNGGGVSRIAGGAITNFTQADGLNNNRVYEIMEDRDGRIWFSTLGAGACRYDGESFTSFSEAEGLTINNHPCPCESGSLFKDCHGPNGAHVQEFWQDTAGNLWFGCSGGLFRLNGDAVVNVTRDGPWPDTIR